MKKIIPLWVLALLCLIVQTHCLASLNDLCNVAHARGAAGVSVAPVSSGLPLQGTDLIAGARVPMDTTPDAGARVSRVPIDTIHRSPDTLHIDEVEISTGYQRIPKERATGSFVFVDSALLNRTFSTDILSRLEGVVSGLRFNRDVNNPDRVDLTLRGPSTIRAADQPLIILDNFEYHGELNNINPNDIANITVLKDAAASSIWGAKAGNGVIVITTKTGRYNQPTKVQLTSNLSVRERPDAYRLPALTSSEYIDLQSDLFARGYYNNTLTNINKPAITPVVYLLEQQRKGLLNEAEATAAINALRGLDSRRDIDRYLLRDGLYQQHALSLSGGGTYNQYYASAGWDDNRQNHVGDDYRRLSLTFNNTIGLFDNRLEVQTGVLYTNSTTLDNSLNPLPELNYPYGRLVDDSGAPAAIARYHPTFLDTVGGGRLLDWAFRPLDELQLADHTTRLSDIKVNANVRYKLASWLSLSGRYQYGSGISARNEHHHEASFFTRDLINQFSGIAPNGEVIRPIPLGGILNLNNRRYTSHKGRGQFDASHAWGIHRLDLLAGAEISTLVSTSSYSRFYGYREIQPGGANVDAVNTYTSAVTGRKTIRIATPQSLTHLTDRFVSFFGSGSYALADRYVLSGSIRRDGSNLFGVRTNQQWTPLWSTGFKWAADRESFYGLEWVSELALRATYGTSGNIDKSVTAYLTAGSIGTNAIGLPSLWILTPPNPDLRWETVSTLNVAADFTLLRTRRIRGSVEWFRKWGRDLMSDAELSALTGLTTYRGNTASLMGHGLDVTLHAEVLTGPVSWKTTLLMSTVRNRITEYRITPTTNANFINGALMVGKPLESLFAYRWGGLNPENGNPIGYVAGEPSETYGAITNSTDRDDMVYMGSTVPQQFGSLRNTVAWSGLELSFLISFKTGYHYRRDLLRYAALYAGGYRGEGAADYRNRWMLPGDETRTQVPSAVYPAVAARDNFYANSERVAGKGDHVRLQDIRLGYRLARPLTARLGLSGVDAFAIVNNVGLLWKAASGDFDPDYGFENNVRNFAFGINLTL